MRSLALEREVEERRQERPRVELPAGDELRYVEDLGPDGLVVHRREGQGAMGGAEVDTDREARHPSSTSAGASTCTS